MSGQSWWEANDSTVTLGAGPAQEEIGAARVRVYRRRRAASLLLHPLEGAPMENGPLLGLGVHGVGRRLKRAFAHRSPACPDLVGLWTPAEKQERLKTQYLMERGESTDQEELTEDYVMDGGCWRSDPDSVLHGR